MVSPEQHISPPTKGMLRENLQRILRESARPTAEALFPIFGELDQKTQHQTLDLISTQIRCDVITIESHLNDRVPHQDVIVHREAEGSGIARIGIYLNQGKDTIERLEVQIGTGETESQVTVNFPTETDQIQITVGKNTLTPSRRSVDGGRRLPTSGADAVDDELLDLLAARGLDLRPLLPRKTSRISTVASARYERTTPGFAVVDIIASLQSQLIDISALRQATELASLDQTSAEGTKMKFLRDLCRDKGRLKGEHTSVEAYFLIAILRDDAIVVRERTRGRQSYYELSSPNWVLPVEFLPETQTLAIFRQGSRLIIDKSGRLVAREGFEFSSNGSLLVGRASRVRLGTRYDMNGIAALVDQDPTEQLSFAKGTNTTLLGNLRVQGLTVENGISDTSGRIMAIVPRDTQAYRDGVDRFILAQSQQALSVIFILNDGTALTYTEISKARNLSGPVEATYINKQNVPDRTVIVEVQKPEHDKPIVLARGSVLGLPSSIVFAIAPALDGTDDANTLVAQAQGLEHSGERSMQAVVETLMGRREGVIHAYEGTSNAVPRGTAIPIRPRILEIAKRDIPSAQHLMVLSHILGRGLEKDGLIRRTSHVGSNSITTLLVAAIRDITPTHLTALPGKSEFSVKKVGDNDQLTITTGEVTLLLDVAWRLPGSIMELSKTGALEAYTTGAQAAEAYVEAVHTVAASRLYFLRREVERYHLRDNKFDVRPEQEEIKLIERIQSALAQIPDNRIKELHQQRQGSLTLSDLRELLGPDIAITTDEGRRVLYAISAQLDRQIAISVMHDIFAGTFKPVSTEIPVAEAA